MVRNGVDAAPEHTLAVPRSELRPQGSFVVNGYAQIPVHLNLPVPAGVDWICVSPKGSARIVQTHGQELKLVYPQAEAPPQAFAGLDFEHFFLQPMDNAQRLANTEAAVNYCMAHPQWRLSLQTHKYIGIP